MRLIDIISKRIDKILESAKNLTFPQILFKLRSATQLSRQQVCNNLSYSYNRLFKLENGLLKGRIKKSELKAFSNYYGISWDVLNAKANEFYHKNNGEKA